MHSTTDPLVNDVGKGWGRCGGGGGDRGRGDDGDNLFMRGGYREDAKLKYICDMDKKIWKYWAKWEIVES